MMYEAVDAHWYTGEMMLTCTNSTYAASKGTAYSCSVSCWCNTRRLFCCLRKCKQAEWEAPTHRDAQAAQLLGWDVECKQHGPCGIIDAVRGVCAVHTQDNQAQRLMYQK